MTGLFKITEFIFTCLEVEMSCVMCNALFRKKWRFSFWILQLGALCCIGTTYFNKFDRGMFSNTAWVVNIALLCLILKICYQISLSETVSFLTAFYAVLFSIDFFTFIVICLISNNETFGIDILNTYSGIRVVIFGILRSLDIFLSILLVKNKNLVLRVLNQTSLLLVLLSGICFYFMIQMQNVQILPVNFDFLWNYAGDIIGILGIGFIYSLWTKHQMDEQDKMESGYLQQTLLQSFAHAKEEMLQTSQKLHDEKKHFRTIRLLLEKDHVSEALEYLHELDASS